MGPSLGLHALPSGDTFKLIIPELIASGLDDTTLQAAIAGDQAVMALLLGGLDGLCRFGMPSL